MKIIEKNINGTDDSFIGRLHEDSIFDIKLLNAFILDIYKLIRNFSKYNYTNSELIDIYIEIFDIFTHTNRVIIANLSKNDLRKLKSLDENYYTYIERLSFVIKCFLKKDYRSIEEYEDDLGKIIREEEKKKKKHKGKKKDDNFQT